MPNGISTIRDFYKVSQDRDFSRKNQLRVLSINSGAGLTVDFTEDDLVYVRTATLPTRTIQTSQATFMGLNFNVPGNVVYEGSDNYQITFFADQQFQLWEKITEWTRQVFDDADSTGNYFTPKASAVIDLLLIDNNLNPVKKITLVGAVCKSAGDMEYEIADEGTLQTFTAVFSYHFWVESDI